MAISFELNAEPRTDTGKGASRRLRRAGKVPAILYGGDKEPQALTLAHNEVLRNLEHEAFYSHILTIKVDGKESPAILRDMQRHPSKPIVMHIDLQRVDMSASLKTNVPLHIVGEDHDHTVVSIHVRRVVEEPEEAPAAGGESAEAAGGAEESGGES